MDNTMLNTDSQSSENVIIETENKISPDETNPYAYLNRDEFSSERFKIEIKNLPKFYGTWEMRKLLNAKLQLASHKIKFPRRNSPYIFVCFKNDEDRDVAIKTISNYMWRGKELIALKAKPAPDPLVKRRNEQAESDGMNKRPKLDDVTLEERLKSSTIPMWKVPYVDQLKNKHEHARYILSKLGMRLSQNNPNLKNWIDKQKNLYNQLPCELLDIRYSNQCDGYRNKCEFSVGINEETSLPSVGFRIGSYAMGKTDVASVENLQHIPDSMKVAVQVYEEFVRSSDLSVFNVEHQTGHFRQLTARYAGNQLMLIAGIHPQDLTEERLSKFKKDLVQFFFEGLGKKANVASLYFQAIVKKKTKDDLNLAEHLHGATHIYETILGLRFRISPEAFFQINTLAAEILYKSAIELAEPTLNSTLIDICCGTGTIGLCFAQKCGQVLGIELIPQAVIDAKENAKSNNIDNCEFFAGKVEEILNSVLYRTTNEDIIAVVDPPRAGLHNKAIQQLRKCKKINKIIYISCNPKAAIQNFFDLGRPASKTMHGEPFVPMKAVDVDLFPHTEYCELIICFERYKKDLVEPPQATVLEPPQETTALEIPQETTETHLQ